MEVKGTKEVSIFTLLGILRKRKRLVAKAAVLVGLAGALYAFSQADRYRAEVLLSSETTAQDYVKAPGTPSAINVQEKLWLIRETLFRPRVLEQVMAEFHLDPIRESKRAAWVRDAWGTVKPSLKSAAQTLGIPRGPGLSEQELREWNLELLKERIKIQVESADAFSIGFEGGDRQQVTNVVNRMADLLIRETSTAGEERAGWAAEFLTEEAEVIKQKLEQQNRQLQAYQRRIPDELPAQLASNQKLIETLQTQLLIKKEQVADDQARRAAVAQEMKELAGQGVLEQKATSPRETKLEELRSQLRRLRASYTASHPEIRSLEAEIRDLESAAPSSEKKPPAEPSPAHLRYLQLQAEQEALDRRLQSSRGQEQELLSQISSYERKVRSTPEHERVLAELKREHELTQTQYQSLMERQNQAQLDERLKSMGQATAFRFVRPASVPLEPYSPSRLRIVLIGVFAGIALGLLLAFLAAYWDTSYDNAEDFRASTSLPLLGMIPAFSDAAPQRPVQARPGLNLRSRAGELQKEHLVTVSQPRSVAAEQYGILATQIRHYLGEGPSKVLAVTSSAGGEGKTLTSLNLSIALSRTARGETLLVEADLRKPRFHEYLGLNSMRGLTDLLRKPDDDLRSYLLEINGLRVLPAGSHLPDPLTTLANPETQLLLRRLREQFRLIVVDCPPILPLADSRVLAGLSDAVIMVVRAGQTRRELLQHALQTFNAPNLLGVVLNGVDLRSSRYSYAYDYYASHYLESGGRK